MQSATFLTNGVRNHPGAQSALPLIHQYPVNTTQAAVEYTLNAANSTPAAGAWLADGAAILLAFGVKAQAISQHIIDRSTEWFGAQPPLWAIAPPPIPLVMGAEDTHTRQREAIAHEFGLICEQIAALSTADDGSNNAKRKTVKLWVIIDIDASAADNTAMTPALATQVTSVLALLEVVAWRHLRLTLQPAFLLLATPTDKNAVTLCRRQLAAIAPTLCYLAGPATQNWADAKWQTQTVTALAALLWAAPAALLQRAPQQRSYLISAADWWAPLPTLKRALALHHVQAALQPHLAAPSATASQTAAFSLHQWLAAGDQLTALVPALPPVALPRKALRWWRTAQDPTLILLADLQIQQAQALQTQRQTRQSWLATHLATWETDWQHYTTRPGSGAFSPTSTAPAGATAQQVQDLEAQIRLATQAADERLLQCHALTAAAEAEVQQARHALAQLCHTLPTCSLQGMGQLVSHPLRWPRWGWQWASTLPRRLRRLSKALTALTAAQTAEANAQIARQLLLAIWQDLREHQRWLVELHQQLTALAAYVAEQSAANQQALPTPWEPAAVARLYQQLATTQNPGNDLATLERLLQPTAQSEWADSTPAAIGEEVLADAATLFDALDDWSAMTWLTTTFALAPTTATPPPATTKRGNQPPAPLAAWLDRLADQAQPSWITATQAPNVVQENWLLTPDQEAERRRQRSPHAWAPPAIAAPQWRQQVQSWVHSRPHTTWVDSPLNSIILLRFIAVE